MDIKISRCNRENLCVDCDNTKCLHCGDKVRDCPKYPQMCEIRKNVGCDNCTWIDSYIEEMREVNARNI